MTSVIFASEGREAFGHDELAHLKRLADADPERCSRYCLHQGDDDPVQEMVIVMCHESEIAPHRERDKRKAYYVLEGALSVEFYDDAARPVERIDMGTPGSGRPFVYRFDADDWHTVIPQTEYVVFVETIEGPFDAHRTKWFPGQRNSVRPVAKPAAVQVSVKPPFPLRCEPTARSLTYFAASEPVEITREVISWLIGESERIGERTVRICMHQDPSDELHQMIVVQPYGNYFPPHRHPEKGEALHVIEGRMAFVTFNDDGSVLRSTILGPKDAPIARCGVAQWHAVIPLSARAVYYEAKPGPYLGSGDSMFAEWAPQSESPEAETYLKRLYQTIAVNDARPAGR